MYTGPSYRCPTLTCRKASLSTSLSCIGHNGRVHVGTNRLQEFSDSVASKLSDGPYGTPSKVDVSMQQHVLRYRNVTDMASQLCRHNYQMIVHFIIINP